MNRPILALTLLLSAACAAVAQVGINNDQSDPDASAMLDIAATDKGVLVPRLTALQRDAIAAPATGLLVYVTDDGVFNYYNGVTWQIVGAGAVDLTDYLNGSDLAGILSISGPAPSASTPVVDATNAIATSSIEANNGKWQSFIALQTGNLAAVQLGFDGDGEITFTSFRIFTSDDPDSPSNGGTQLYEATNFTATGPWATVTIDPAVPVVAGQRFFIVTDATGSWRINNDGDDVYPDGRAITDPNDDFAFSTFVRPPVAALAVDSVTGAVGLANGALEVVGSGTGRILFNAESGSIFVGVPDAADFDPESAGSHSISFGANSLASGDGAFAAGDFSVASGNLSFAAGKESVASGRLSLALGDTSTATAQASVAIGDRARAGDLYFAGATIPGAAVGSVALGKNVASNGLGAFAIGQDTTARGTLSLAFGNQALTEGENAFAIGNRAEAYGARSVAAGDRVKAYGDASVALGLRNNAQSYAEFVVGSYTPDYTPASTTAWNASDRLFVVGNGPDSSHRSTALIVYKNGNATLNGQLTLGNGSGGITLPNTDGSVGQLLATNGSGTVSWVDGPTGALAGITSLTGPASIAPAADAGSEVGGESYDLHDGEARQTFTALASGPLRTLELDFYVAVNPAPATVAIYAGDHATDTLPGSALASQAISITTPGWFTLDFGTGVTVTAGEIYTIVVTLGDTVEPAYWLEAFGEDPYAGGRASTDAGDDFHFRTFVGQSGDVALLALDSNSGQVSLGNGNVVVDTSASPDIALAVNGPLQVADGTQAAGYLATSDANGTLTWVDPATVSTAPDADSDPTNELQTLSLSGTDLTLSNGGGTVSIADGDSDPTNELQTLSLDGDTLTLSDGGAVDLSAFRPGSALTDITSIAGSAPTDAESAVVDQSNQLLTVSASSPSHPWRQTFTAGVTGVLHSVRLEFYRAVGQTTVEVFRGDHGDPANDLSGATPLGSVVLSTVGSEYVWFEFPFEDVVSLTAGEVYTLQITTDADSLLGYNHTNPYPGGSLNNGLPYDLVFETKMRVAPSLLVLNADDSVTLGSSGHAVVSAGPLQASSLRLQDGNQSSGRILVSDANGVMTWTDPETISTAPDGDSSATNELQTLSLSGTNLTLSNGGGTVSIADGDSSATNELQTVSRSGNTVTLSNSGGSFNLGQLSSLSIFGTLGETNSMLFQGQSNQDMWLNFRSGGGGTVGAAGALFSRFGSLHFFVTNNSGWLDFAYSAEDTDTPDLANASRVLRLTSAGNLGVGDITPTTKLDVNGALRVRGGSPLIGKALIATDTAGTADWRFPSLNANSVFITSVGSVAGSATGWQDVAVTQSQVILPDLVVGDRVMIMISCRVRVGGTTGVDDYSFRFASAPALATFANMAPTGLLENLDQHRNQWQELSFHRVATVSGAGHAIISLQVNMDNADDTIEFTDIELTAYKL